VTVVELRVDSIAAGGDGVGRNAGHVVFVPRSAPGDLVRVEARAHDRFMRGRILDILEPARTRVEPPCGHYVVDRCGGCQLQHISLDAQIDAKAGIIRDAMIRIGRVAIAAPPVEPSDRPLRYRQKLTLAMRRRNERWIAGLHRYDTQDVFELRDCLITQERVLEAWSAVLEHERLLPVAGHMRAAVRLLSGGFSFTVEGARAWSSHADLFKAVPDMSELWWKPEDKSRRLLHSRTSQDAAGASFTQVNPGVADRLRRHVVALASRVAPRTAVDGYAGTGDIAIALAELGARVVAIEMDRDAARVCAGRLPQGSRAITGAVEDVLPQVLPADVVVLNPPRAGLDARVTKSLTREIRIQQLIYVSCNPATLARDVRRLDGYCVRSVRGFDMFPQTAHVETVCELEPAP
jgi:23S rRNA (uracil1939-C5)-methyltransferase